jgi:glycosyltransferase involved in cell wall biosynthesis
MKITYISETSINKSAQILHVLKMCDAFSKKGKVNLIIPFKEKKIDFQKIKKKYLFTSKKKFEIKSLLNSKVSNFLFRIIFAFCVPNYLKKSKVELIISRSWMSSIFLSIFKIKHFLEIHSEFTGLTKFLMVNLNFINSNYILRTILISKTLASKLTIIKREKILILHDAVDIKNFKYKKNVKKIESATYIGSFHEGKGVELILELAKKFSNLEFNIYGKPLIRFQNISKNLKFHGYINYNQVPKVLKDSDVLLLPSAEKQFVGMNVNIANYNSPLKMFDYLASGGIIISSKRDGICEVLKHRYNSIIVKKYDIKNWANALNKVIKKKYNLKKLSKNSIITSKKYTWEQRANRILQAYYST